MYNYNEIISKVQSGTIIIGIEPAIARKFFTDSDMTHIKRDIGLDLFWESFIIKALIILAFCTLLITEIISIFTLNWYSIAFIPLFFLIYVFYQSKVSFGKQTIWRILIFTIMFWIGNFVENYTNTLWSLFIFFIPLPFLFIRLVYYVSCCLLRFKSLNSERLFYYLYEKAIFIKEKNYY